MKKITAGRDMLGEFAPKFAQLNDDVLFGEVWSRESELSARDRSLVTVTALMAQGLTDTSFGHHLAMAKENGITRSEIAEILTHAAFYAGWPKAWAAFRMAKDIWVDEESTDEKQLHQSSMVFPIGAPNDGFAQYFSGQSYLAPVSTEQVKIFNVTFEPGCRKLDYPRGGQGRRTDPYLRGRARLLSGMGQRAAGAAPRRCSQHYARCQALARRCAGQLVFPSGCGSTWRKLPQSVV